MYSFEIKESLTMPCQRIKRVLICVLQCAHCIQIPKITFLLVVIVELFLFLAHIKNETKKIRNDCMGMNVKSNSRIWHVIYYVHCTTYKIEDEALLVVSLHSLTAYHVFRL